MLRLRPSQVDDFNNAARNGFHMRLRIYLRENFPEQTESMDDSALERSVQTWQARVAAYGGTSELAIAQWACLSLSIGFQPDELDEFRNILRVTDRPIEDTLDKVITQLNYFISANVRIDDRAKP